MLRCRCEKCATNECGRPAGGAAPCILCVSQELSAARPRCPSPELATGLPKRTRRHLSALHHGAGLAGPPHLTLRPDVLHSSGESPRLRLGDRREATWHALRPTHAKLCGAVGCAAAVQRGARLSRGSGAVPHREAGGQVRSVGHARAQPLLLLVRRHRLACSPPPPGAASTGSVPSHAWSHVRRAGTRSRG